MATAESELKPQRVSVSCFPFFVVNVKTVGVGRSARERSASAATDPIWPTVGTWVAVECGEDANIYEEEEQEGCGKGRGVMERREECQNETKTKRRTDLRNFLSLNEMNSQRTCLLTL